MIHLESVVDAPRGSLPPPTDPAAQAAVAAGKKLYADSIESLVGGVDSTCLVGPWLGLV